MNRLIRYIKKNNEASDSVKGQNIILLLGDTGTGKSTTIHFLAGSKMHQIKKGRINHIEPKEITNKFL
jgi:Fe-S cluster assembly ATPase SufC